MPLIKYRRPSEVVTVGVLVNQAVAATVRLGVTEVAGGVWQSKPANLALRPLAPGTYAVRAIVIGCPPSPAAVERYRTELEVRRIATPHQRAELLSYQAGILVGTGQCDAALRKIALVEAHDPSLDVVLGVKAYCAERSGNLEQALALFEELQARYERMVREYQPPPGTHITWGPGVADRISGIKKRLGRSGDEKPSPRRP